MLRSRTTTYRFDEVSLSAQRSGLCAGCQKRTTRTIKVFQTLNPFNRNPHGLPKSREEILVELRSELATLRASPLRCTACETS
jgi:hypothetical protein